MSSTALCTVILLVCGFTFSAAQTSCKGRCGAEYYRGSFCQCDYNCLSYGECCKDFESQCTTKNSCKGRCGETFKRGRLCSCDHDCANYKQCCPDYKSHCDADEEISGAASAAAPVKTNSCNNINNNKPKEPILNEPTEQTSTFSEGNNADDHLIPLVSPTSDPSLGLSDDMYGQIFPSDDISSNAAKDPQASLVPESTSGYGPSTADLLDQISPEPTQDPDTLEVNTETQTTLSDDNDSPSATEETPTESTDLSDPDAGTTLPQPTTAGERVSSQPSPTSGPQTAFPTAANIPEPETTGQAEAQLDEDVFPEAQNADPTDAPSDDPEVDTSYPPVASAVPTEASSTVLEDSQVTTVPTTSNQELDDTQSTAEDTATGSPEDPSVTVSPTERGNLSELDDLTTRIPTSTDDIPAEVTTADPVNVTPDATEPAPSEATSKPQDTPDLNKPSPDKPTLTKPSSKPETKPLDTAQTLSIDDTRDYQADDNNDTNLCSGRPVGAVTTLRNGTVVVFRGHYFWFLDRNRVPGPARGITQVWGVPSPVDTVFTRCNCQGKTYIFKGSLYWRFENDVLDPGYPKVIQTGFDGLRGQITAALSVPQYQRRRESVYFFKRGGLVQKYSYQFGTSPTCGKKPQYSVYTVHNRVVRQAASLLGPAINIRTSWRGFPSTVTAAVSVPSNTEPEGYKYYVFSRSKSYNVRIDSQRPVIAAPAANAPPQSNNFNIQCPKKV